MAADGPQLQAGARLLHMPGPRVVSDAGGPQVRVVVTPRPPGRIWPPAMAAAPPERPPDGVPGVAPAGYSATRQARQPRASGRGTGTTAVAGMCTPKHGIQAFKHGCEIFSMMLGN
jgi:hypothetical protein